MGNEKGILCIGNFALASFEVGGRVVREATGGMGFRFVLVCLLFGVPVGFVTVIGKEKKWAGILGALKENGGRVDNIKRIESSVFFSWRYDEEMNFLGLGMKNMENMDLIPALVTEDLIRGSLIINLCSLGLKNEKKIVKKVLKVGRPLSYIFHESNLYKATPRQYLEMFEALDFLFLNEKESFLLTGKSDNRKAGAELSCYAKRVFITRDRRGVLVFSRKRLIHKCRSLKIKVRDANGAGDVFAGGTMAGYYLTRSVKSACRFGSMAAALSLTDFLTSNLHKMICEE